MDLFVRVSLCWIALVVTALASGCNDSRNGFSKNQNRGGAMSEILPLAQRQSGYVPGLTQWNGFMSCWEKSARRNYAEKVKNNAAEVDLSLLGVDVKQNPSEKDHTEAIAKLENDLGVTLPQSYKDFLTVYRPPYLRPRKLPWGEALIGFFAPSQVGYFAKLRPDTLRIFEENPFEATDKDYFVYGAKQDGVFGRTRNLRNAILIGQHGDALHELILLYPDVKTADGEMEAAVRFHSEEYRAPSFAELMRQLSMLETSYPAHVPPYSQEVLKGTCADQIALVNVWWD